MAAFDWSPGGCCCVESGWFDVWMTATQGKLERLTTLRPISGGNWNVTSAAAGQIDWFIPYVVPNQTPLVSTTATGFPAFGGRVWSIESRATPSSGTYLACYDSVTRTQLFAVPWNGKSGVLTPYTMFTQFNPGFNVNGRFATSQTGAGDYDGASTLTTVSSTGVVTTTTGSPASVTTGPISNQVTETVNCFSWRNWPRGAGSRTRRVNGQIVESELFYGDIIATGSALTIINRQPAVSTAVNGTLYEWVAFDSSPTHWVGIVIKRPPFSFPQPPPKIQLIINFQLIVEYDYIETAPGHSSQSGPVRYFGEPHVCHPHETLGDGWIAVPTLPYYQLPTTGSPIGIQEDPTHSWKIVFYKNGVESWRTPAQWPTSTLPPDQWNAVQREQAFPPQVHHSSDRWIYVDDLTWGKRSAVIPDHFRHDGSASFRTGKFQANGTILPDQFNPPNVGRIAVNFTPVLHFRSVVQNSSEIPGGLPLEWPPASIQ